MIPALLYRASGDISITEVPRVVPTWRVPVRSDASKPFNFREQQPTQPTSTAIYECIDFELTSNSDVAVIYEEIVRGDGA